MKKQGLILLLVVVLLCAAMIAVQAEDQTPTEAQKGEAVAAAANAMTFPTDYSDYVADCPACGEKQVTWKAVKYKGRVGYNTTGHFYCSDITASPHPQFIGLDNGGTVCLHLNGETLTNGGRIAVLGGSSVVNIMGEGTVIGNGSSGSDYAQGVLLVQNSGTLNLYGGTYTSALADMPVAVAQHKGSAINLYAAAAIDSAVGHNVDIINGTFNQYGGVIQNAVTTGSGGNVRIRSANGMFNLYGGEIRNGSSSAMNAGGNVYITGGGQFLLHSGKLTGGKGTGMYSHGADVYIYNGLLAMYGGEVDGQIAAAAGQTVYLDGTPVIAGSGLWLESGAKVTWGELKDGTSVTVCAEGAFTEADEKAASYASFFRTPSQFSKILLRSGALYCEADCTADSQAPASDGKSLKILAITSSFGLNTTEFLYDIAVAQGATDVVVARLYASGCSLKKHVTWANEGTAGYEYTKNSTGTWEKTLNVSLLEGLQDEDWDIIYLQQSAANAPAISTYEDYIDQLVEIVQANKTNPEAKLVWNMTWAYQGNSTQPVFVEDFKSNQLSMYNAIVNVIRKKVQVRTDFAVIIPSGTAIQNARTSYYGDTLTRDTYHANNLGKVIAGYTAYAALTDTPLTEIKLDRVSCEDNPEMLVLLDSDKKVILEAVNTAIQKPFEVTQSSYTTNPNPGAANEQVIRGAAVARAAQAMTFPTDGSDFVADCPACGEKQVTWKAISGSNRVGYNTTGHFYCTDITRNPHTQFIGLDNGGTVCLHLNGQILQNNGRIAVLGGSSTVNMMGSGKVIGIGTAGGDYALGVLVAQNSGTINLYGGTYLSVLENMPVAYLSGGESPKINLYADAVIDSNVGHNVDVVTGTFTMYGGTIQNGVSTGRGGNVRLRSGIANFRMYAGTVYGGASSDAAAGGNVYITGGGVCELHDGIIAGGKSTAAAGKGGNVYVNSGTFRMTGGHILEDGQVYITENGAFITEDVTVKGAFGNAAAVDGKVWIDLLGNQINATGSGMLRLYDSANDAYEQTQGAATLADTVTVLTDVTAPNGNRYIALRDEEGVYSFHRLDMGLKAVSLRLSACGIYYKAVYHCDAVLAQKVSSYGVVFSLQNMPGTDFMTETGEINIATAQQPDGDFGKGTEATSGSVFNIMRRGLADNAARGQMPIYANAYVVIDGAVLVADNANAGKQVTDQGFDGVAYSLLDVLKACNDRWDGYVATGEAEAIREFYSTWAQQGMEAWAKWLPNIAG